MGIPKASPSSSRSEDGNFFRRNFWPPSLLGGLAIALVVSVMVGFLGAYAYTSSERDQIRAQDLAGRPAPEAPLANAPDPNSAATTTTVETLSPAALTKKVARSIWTVGTLDDAGRPIEGSAFVTGSNSGRSFLLTSLSVVRSATRIPGPPIVVRSGGQELEALLWTWHDERDLALLAIDRVLPSIGWASDAVAASAGQKVYGASGAGPELIAGVINSTSPAAIAHNIFTEGTRPGGALISERGEVLGVLSGVYDPAGTATDRVFYAVPVRAACERVLACGGTTTTTKVRGGPTTAARAGAPTTATAGSPSTRQP